ncbi:inorganic phosphate transporter [Marinobacter sp.]|uniref:inorganic phosphate transporter n=1 Tax=Marinobacter sp. TaxID=50741 RepID=UPI003561F928
MARSSGFLDTLLSSPTTERYRVGISLLFLLGVWLTVGSFSQGMPNSMLLMAAAVIGGYMAINIGANDVANNVGPAVGSGALSLGAAVVIAAIFEAGGAIIAGGDVVSTIKGGIIDPSNLEDGRAFVWLMTAALLAGALWLNLATWMGAPVSTTHSIVGGVLGAGIAAGGWGIADWAVMGKIAASWVISPVLGGALAALFLFAIKKTVLYRKEVIPAARTFVPWLVAIMAWAFGTYLMIKGVKKIVKVDFLEATLIGLAAAAVVFFIMRTLVGRMASTMENSSAGVNTLFTWPLIFAAALLSFAHGANDVANAIGPLAAINDALAAGSSVVTSASIPMWVMMVGALGLAVGLMLFGPRLIKTVGSEITELDKTRAFCIALSAALTVILASQLGLPVSSTHIAIGGVFGVGFLREYLKSNYATQLHKIMEHHDPAEQERLKPFLDDFRNASVEEMENLLKQAKKKKQVPLSKSERKRLKKIYREEMVKRSHLVRIAAAWIITVPASAMMAAILFFTLRGLLI